MLQRSRGAPLSVKFNCKVYTSEELQTVFLKALLQASRLRELVVAADEGTTNFSSVLSHLSNPAPCLESFALTHRSDLAKDFPETFFGGHAPQLRELALNPCPAHLWKTLPLGSTSLTKLTLRSSDGHPRPTFGDFAAALSHMPRLITLVLSNCLPLGAIENYGSPQDRQAHTEIALPALESLRLYDGIRSAHKFFTFTKLPRLTSGEVTLKDDTIADEEAPSLFLAALGASCTNMARGSMVAFSINQHIYPGPQFHLSFPSKTSLELTFYDRWLSLEKFIAACHSRFDLSNVSSLNLMDTTFMSEAVWTATLSRLPKLNVISLLGVPPFPALSSIELAKIHFNPDEPEDPEESVSSDTIDRLIEGLSWREESRPVSRLDIWKCAEFRGKDYLKIKEAVQSLEVVWDRSRVVRSWDEMPNHSTSVAVSAGQRLPPTWACYEQIRYEDEDYSDSDSDSCSEDDEDYVNVVSQHRSDGPTQGDSDSSDASATGAGVDGGNGRTLGRPLDADDLEMEMEMGDDMPRRGEPPQKDIKGKQRARSQGFVWNQDLFVPPYIKDRYIASTSPPSSKGFISASASSTNSALTDYEVEVVEIRIQEGEIYNIIP
ncbi:hypothetical protein NMY22_g1147 [Coprinellus aureogranulatus]|nr:hypothetical protein NMY22_g1147 [Coprinellus aureogranulatus]